MRPALLRPHPSRTPRHWRPSLAHPFSQGQGNVGTGNQGAGNTGAFNQVCGAFGGLCWGRWEGVRGPGARGPSGVAGALEPAAGAAAAVGERAVLGCRAAGAAASAGQLHCTPAADLPALPLCALALQGAGNAGLGNQVRWARCGRSMRSSALSDCTTAVGCGLHPCHQRQHHTPACRRVKRAPCHVRLLCTTEPAMCAALLPAAGPGQQRRVQPGV